MEVIAFGNLLDYNYSSLADLIDPCGRGALHGSRVLSFMGGYTK
jgi:hypothetical protein